MLKVESYRKGIVLSSAFNVFNKVLLFVNSLLIAYYFGTQLKMDIYFYAYNTVLIVSTFLSAANTSVVIPESMRIRVRQNEDHAEGFLNLFIFGYLGLTLLLGFVFWANPVRIFTTISKYDTGVLQQQVNILTRAVPLLVLVPMTTLLTDILASYRFFTIPVIASIVNSVFSLVFLVAFHRSLDVQSILLGLLISYSANILMLLLLMKRSLHWNFRNRPRGWPKTAMHNILISQTGNLLTSLGTYAPLYFLSGTVSGIVASLNYAQQLVGQANSLITIQVAMVSRIKLSELYAQRKYKKVNEIFISTIRFLLFVLLPVSGLMFLYADEIVSVLFKRGSFDERSVQLSGDMLRYLALSLPFTAIVSIAANLYIAAQLIKISIAYQVISNAVLIGLIAVCTARLGYIGYPVAYLVINIVNAGVVYIYCANFFPFIRYTIVMRYLGLLFVYNAAIVLILRWLGMHHSGASRLETIVIGGTIYLTAMLVLTFRFKLNEDFNNLLTSVWQRVGSSKTNPTFPHAPESKR